MDGAIEPAAAQEIRVGRVHNGVNVHIADISVDGHEAFSEVAHLITFGIGDTKQEAETGPHATPPAATPLAQAHWKL